MTCSEKQSLRNCWDWEKDNRKDPACLRNHFPSSPALPEPALVFHWVNTSEYLLSPQADIPTFIYRLLGAYIGVLQGLVFGATLFLFYLALKSIEPNQKILPLRHRHTRKRQEQVWHPEGGTGFALPGAGCAHMRRIVSAEGGGGRHEVHLR